VQVDTASGPWTGPGPSRFALAAFSGDHPVVLGTVGNELAIWSATERQVANGATASSPTNSTAPGS
jgi:hypothetical protein